MKKKLLLIFIATMALYACKTKSDDAHIVMLYDVSASTNPSDSRKSDKNSNGKQSNNGVDKIDDVESMRAVYLKETKAILGKLLPGTEIRGSVITDQPLSITDFPIKEELPSSDFLFENEVIQNSEMQKIKDRVSKKVEGFLGNNNAMYTCIVDALLFSRKLF